MRILALAPAAAILPVSEGFAFPRNITAPGAAKTRPVKKATTTESANPRGYIRNSDHNPHFCATNLWESSWTKKAVTIPKKAIGMKKKYDSRSIGEPRKKNRRLFFENVNENAMDSTTMAIIR